MAAACTVREVAVASNYLISLTSVPRRFDQALPAALNALREQSLRAPILLNIPAIYRKWGPAADLPPALLTKDVEVFQPSEDFGPATKLMGAIEYARRHGGIDYVITVDDDVILARNHLQYLVECSGILPKAAITVGGIRLQHPPFRYRDGLDYRSRLRTVHLPAGYRGVVYPLAPLLEAGDVPFTLREHLPECVFNDDDVYFGCLLAVLGVHLFAVPGSGGRTAAGAGASAVAEAVEGDRVDNEMSILQAAIAAGVLKVPPAPMALTPMHTARLMLAYLRQRSSYG